MWDIKANHTSNIWVSNTDQRLVFHKQNYREKIITGVDQTELQKLHVWAYSAENVLLFLSLLKLNYIVKYHHLAFFARAVGPQDITGGGAPCLQPQGHLARVWMLLNVHG